MSEVTLQLTGEILPPNKADSIVKKTEGVGEKLRKKLTYAGRKEEYMEKYEDCMNNRVTGRERFELRKQLENEAKKYAIKRVAAEVLIAAATVGTAVGVAHEIKTGNIKNFNPRETLRRFAEPIVDFVRTEKAAFVKNYEAKKIIATSTPQAIAETVIQQSVVKPTERAVHNAGVYTRMAPKAAERAFWGFVENAMRGKKPQTV